MYFLCTFNDFDKSKLSVQVGQDNVLDEPLVCEDEVVAVGVEEDELAGLVQGPQAYPVLEVDRRLSGKNRLVYVEIRAGN